MKKFKSFILAGGFLVSAFAASAQNADRLLLVESGDTTFAPHLFIQPQIGGAYTLGEDSFGRLLSPAAALNVGYYANELWAVRGGISGWQAKGSARYDYIRHPYKFNYIQVSADAVLDVTNVLRKWTPEDRWSSYAFLGIGCNVRFHNDEAVNIGADGYPFDYLWTGCKWGFAGRGGIGGSYKLNELLDINVELNTTGIIDHFNSKRGRHSNIDWQFNALFGVTFHIGERSHTYPSLYSK